MVDLTLQPTTVSLWLRPPIDASQDHAGHTPAMREPTAAARARDRQCPHDGSHAEPFVEDVVMRVVTLIGWIVTALAGATLFSIWLARGGLRRRGAGASRFPPALIFDHPILAATGLVLLTALGVGD